MKNQSMGLPSINQWIDTVTNPHGRFRSLGEFEAELDAYGNVRFTAGNSAAVFRVMRNGRPMMLKCYIKDDGQRGERYRLINELDNDLLIPVRFMREEAYVYDDLGKGCFRDLLMSEWVEGNTLEVEIRRAGREIGKQRFRELAALFNKLSLELLEREWAHGDIKPENIVVTPGGKAVLIDYDAMFLPGIDRNVACEIGTPGYQHPLRDETHYGPYLDDYPVALIFVTLHALALDKELYGKYYKSEGIILDPNEIMAGTSAAFGEILDLFASHGEYALYELALALKSPTPAIRGVAEVIRRCSKKPSTDKELPTPELFESAGLWGYRRLCGEIVIAPIFEEAFEFSEGFGVVILNGCPQVIDINGRMVICGTGYDIIKPFSCSRAAFRREGKWGYIDTAGNEAIPASFERAGTMHDGLAAVRIDGMTGFVDTLGKMVIEPRFDYARGFRGGKAEVSIGCEIYNIDRSGRRS